jgi:hypothetical protein
MVMMFMSTANRSLAVKPKKKLTRLQRRIKQWDMSGGHNKASGHSHRRPGSLKKN